MQPRKNGMGATNIKVINNIIEGGKEAAKIEGPYPNASWSGNIIFQTAGAGDMPEGSYAVKDPNLTRDQSGIFHLASDNSTFSDGRQTLKQVSINALNPEEVGAHQSK